VYNNKVIGSNQNKTRLILSAWTWRIPLLTLILVEGASFLHLIEAQPSFTTAGLLLQSFVFLIFFEWFHHYIYTKHGRLLPWWIVSGIVLCIVLDATGDYLGWYGSLWYFDTVLHFSLPAAAVAGFWGIRKTLGLETSFSYLWWTVAPCVTTLGAMYEMEEYLEDYFTGSHRLGDGFDTANDLLMDFLGAFSPVIIVYIIKKVSRGQSKAK